jgi:Flp pilus assembly protein TadG
MRTTAIHRHKGSGTAWRQRGQGVAEFALVLPVLLLLVFMIIEVGRLLHAWLAIENGARFAVRYAITGEFEDVFFDDTICANYYAQFSETCDTLEKKENAARVLSIVDAARAGATAILRDESRTWDEPSFFDVTLCPNRTPFVYSPSNPDNWVSDWSSDCGPYFDAGQPGNRVVITVDFNHPLIVPFLSSAWPWLHLTASREGRVEEFRVSRLVGLDPTLVLPSPTPLPTATPSTTFTPLPTSTASITITPSQSPTVTPTPDCSVLEVVNTWTSGILFEMSVRNNGTVPFYLSRSFVDWYDYYPNQRLWDKYWNGSRYARPNDASPPTTTNLPAFTYWLPGGATRTWYANFINMPSNPGIVGPNSVTLTFDGRCDVSGSVNIATPTPSLTPTPSNTPTPSRTPTPSPIPTNTFTPSITPTPSRTLTPSITPTVPTPTPTRTNTPITPTNTSPPATATNTLGPPTVTPTPSATNTPPPFEF